MVKERVFVSTWSDAIMNDVLFCPTNHVTAIIREDNLRPYLFNTEIMLFSVLIWGGGECAPKLTLVLYFSPSLPCPLPKTRLLLPREGLQGLGVLLVTRTIPSKLLLSSHAKGDVEEDSCHVGSLVIQYTPWKIQSKD